MTVTLEEAQRRLPELIAQLATVGEIAITEGERTIARLLPVVPTDRRPRIPGTLRGTVLHISDDFDEPLEDFREYME